ncbi:MULTISPECIES: recombinase family protein [unclassified Granulicatella]|uniref:recombinase family protein n=1 Tax=unclassified Granulicatella TaxID=2630493 RepID=UPI0010742EC7|nr:MULTISPECIES: recombinase family protein [unclassified Granulicatella]MBF0780464.1 recombinase family protein [Granulicatella sp. 19428wC4_WM01]TFU95366.1 recombinase family protein [Granulicatella sp. WM01]
MDLLQSLSNQVSYYNKLIQSHSDWEFKGVYIDKGVSCQTKHHRKEYQRLIQDCKNREIDVILTKSISRFGRNTVELLKTIRQLKQRNIAVRFEKENIDTMTTDGELLITLLASVAQEETTSISENIRWRIKERFEQGLPYRSQNMYGYRWDEKLERYVINEHESLIIQHIFKSYLDGKTPAQISKILNHKGETTRKGYAFTRSTIHKFLNQEVYTGQLILQKTYHVGYKGKLILNTGERPRYIVEDAHESIISKEMFNEVQQVKAKEIYT